jgi:1-acyl-sn-glycerol-3-phosphate acyltransferase
LASLISDTADALVSRLRSILPERIRTLEGELQDSLQKASLSLNEYGYDPYGFQPETAWSYLLPSALLYRLYFRAETYGIENVPRGRVLLIANHAGQFAYDGAMLAMSMLLAASPPRLARGMGEYFLWKMPWMGLTASRIGTMVGTPENCVAMLDDGECVMVFPEGARGASKPFHKRYQLQRFGLGFMRLALQTRTPIVPIGIVGSEEQQPGLANFTGVAEKLGLPSLPITVTAPWLGPLGILAAAPVKYHIHFGQPLEFEGDPNDEDAVVESHVVRVKEAMADLLQRGREQRTGIFT